jgi:hypothetical protein
VIKFFINLIYRNNPECICGYKMKPVNIKWENVSWKCLWEKECGYEAYETWNGTMHWFKS